MYATKLLCLLPVAVASPLATRQTDEPCAQLSDLSQDNTTFLPADLTLACLRSVPLAKEGNSLQLAGIQTFLQAQSDLEYHSEPPQGWLYPGVNLTGSLDKLSQNLADDCYDNEYDFQVDLFKLISSAYDGHLTYLPDIVGVFSFFRVKDPSAKLRDAEGVQADNLVSLISVVREDDELPGVYGYDDLAALQTSASADYTPSAIEQINGEDVEQWLNTYASQNGKSRDPDANYNSIFQNVPGNGDLGEGGDLFAYSSLYQGNKTTLSFANGTERTIATVAALNVDQTLENVTDGRTFVQNFCNFTWEEKQQQFLENYLESPFSQSPFLNVSEPPSRTQVPYEPISTSGVKPPNDAFPSPIAIANDGSIAGYLPSDESLEDTAVLSIQSFLAQDYIVFENTVRQLLATANAHDRSKLIIDLRGNGGGAIFLAYDLFRQLFPSEIPYGAGNYRQSDLLDFTGRTISANIDRIKAQAAPAQHFSVNNFPFDYRVVLDAQNEPFDSWQAIYQGPSNNDDENPSPTNLTSLTRHNLTEVSNATIPIYGYPPSNPDPLQPRTFDPSNILLLTDGRCASTCALFADLLHAQPGVRRVAVGGRPQTGPMQALGGTRGAQVLGFSQLYSGVALAAQYASLSEQLALLTSSSSSSGAGGASLLDTATQALSRAALSPASAAIVAAGVNFRNLIREGDDAGTPLQFVYEAAECRFFYTAEMWARQAAVWARAGRWAWGEEGAEEVCVAGSTGWSADGTGEVPEGARNFFGGNGTVFPEGSLGAAVEGEGEGAGQSSEEGEEEGAVTDGDAAGGGGSGQGDGQGSGESGAGALWAGPRVLGTVALVACTLGVALVY